MHVILAGLILSMIPPVSNETPNRQPQFATSKDVVALVYGSGKSVMFAKSEDRGNTFGAPVRIAEVPVLPLSRHRGPRVVFSGKIIVVSAIGGTAVATGPHAHGLPSDGNLLVWRSTDGGRTWSKAVTVNDAPSSAREGLHAIATDGEGHVAAAWLDLRSGGTQLYGSVSNDGGVTWSRNSKLYQSPDGTICQCCHPSLVALGGGEFSVMFRNVLAGSRDMYVLRMRSGRAIATPQKVGNGTWSINACPMDGGGIALSKGRTITAWRRDQDVFLAVPGGGETRLGEGKDVALTARDEKVFAVWNAGGEIRAYAAGRVELLSKEGAFPSITALPDGSALVAWEEKGAISLGRVPYRR